MPKRPPTKFITAGALATLASPASAVILVYDIDPAVPMNLGAAGNVFSAQQIDLGAGTFLRGSGSLSSTGFLLRSVWGSSTYISGEYIDGFTNPETGEYYPGYNTDGYYFNTDIQHQILVDGGMATAVGNTVQSGPQTVRRFLQGEAIGASAGWTTEYKIFNQVSYGNQNDGSWHNPIYGSFGYAGLRLVSDGQTYYGWLEGATQGDEFSFTRFAFNNVAGQGLYAGTLSAVPEASTLGFAGGLFGLVAAAHFHARRRRQASASASLLALAAGEKLV